MPLIIEDGTGLPDAQSYATAAQLQDYAAARGVTLTDDPEHLLMRAMDYAGTLQFAGRRASRDQALQWPRTNAVIDGYYVDSDVIPSELVRAQIVTAMAIDDGRDPLAAIETGVKQEVVGPLSVTYQDSDSSSAINVDINRAWAKLLSTRSGGMNQIRVVRV